MRKLTREEQESTKLVAEKYKNIQRNPFCAVLDNIRSVYNVGAMFRTSDAVLLEKLYLCGFTATPPRPDLTKTALLAEHSVPWEYQKDATKLIRNLKKKNYQIVSLEITNKSFDYTKAFYEFPLCLVVGNELTGVKDEILDLSDIAIHIPMLGKCNSLNVATAYGVTLFEVLRQYRKA